MPTISETEALNKALTTVGAKEYAWQNPPMEQWIRTKTKDSTATFFPTGELLVYPIMDSLDSITYQLAYQYNIVASQPFASEIVIINALTGSILNQYTTFSSAFGDACTRYSGTVAIETTLNTISNNFELHDQSNGRNIVTRNMKGGTNPVNLPNNPEFQDPNDLISPNDWTCLEWDNIDKDNAALDAHWAAEMTYDYFKQVHNRDSYDGLGSVLNVYVHFMGPNGVNAAEWLGTSGSASTGVFGIALGDGDGTTYNPFVSLDIVAHEFGHGVTQFTANLPASPKRSNELEPAAINEGLSDIWGAVVENWVVTNGFNGAGDTDKDTWLLGEEMVLGNFKADRSMRDPKGFFDPLSNPIKEPTFDTYVTGLWTGGTRKKSGVIDYWFYLLSDGSSLTDGVNDNGDVFNFAGIGINKAADIVYLAETIYFTSLTDFKDARQATLQAAKDLYGSCSIEAQTVSEAWDAVGVPVNINFNPYGATVDACGNNFGNYNDSVGANIVIAAGDILSAVAGACPNPVTVLSGSSAVFKAGNQIFLGAGFKAETNSTFRAYTFDCTGAGNYRIANSNTSNNKAKEYKQTNRLIKNKINIYPNPNTGKFTIEMANVSANNLVEIYDIMGKKIWSKIITKNKIQINIANHPKGIYLVKVLNGNKVSTQKIIYQ